MINIDKLNIDIRRSQDLVYLCTVHDIVYNVMYVQCRRHDIVHDIVAALMYRFAIAARLRARAAGGGFRMTWGTG